jgi:hypothetical protein
MPRNEKPADDLDGFLPTARHYANNNHVVRVTCSKCRGKMRLDLETLARGRHADTALENLPIKCAACGSRKFTVTIEYVDPLQSGRTSAQAIQGGKCRIDPN